MQVSRMIAEVGGIVNVSGNRIATPFAPPSPGSTPMIVPSTMPTTAMTRLNGVMATWKPRSRCSMPAMAPSVSQPSLERTLRQGHQEPHLEDQEGRHGNRQRHDGYGGPPMPADPPHVGGEIQDA